MSTQLLLGLDLTASVVAAALFLTAGVITLSGRPLEPTWFTPAALGCAIAAVVVTGGRVAVDMLLTGRGWWFVQDKILLSLPLTVLTAVLAGWCSGGFLIARVRRREHKTDRRVASAALFCAGHGAAAGLLVVLVVGYPVDLVSAAVVTALVVGLCGITWVGLTAHRGRALTAVFAVLMVGPAVSATGAALYRDTHVVAPGGGGSAHGDHGAAVETATDRALGDTRQVSVADLRLPPGDQGRPLRTFTLSAGQETVTLPSGRSAEALTFGSLPGPDIRVRQGDLVEVTLVNRDIPDGVTVHWHGYPVPNGDDGVAGVTQDAVPVGSRFTYRFVATVTGTYWYHAHQVSSESVPRGLFGAFVVEPLSAAAGTDLVVPVHTIDGITMIGGTDVMDRRAVDPGTLVRLRIINTDFLPHRISISGAPYTVMAVDGTDLNAPTPVTDRVLRIPAGGRVDVQLTMPDEAVSVGLEGAPKTGMWLTSDGSTPTDEAPFQDAPDLDFLQYGTAMAAPGMSHALVTREATLVLDRQFRFLNGVPTLAYTINGAVHPHVPPILVEEGDLLRLTVVNRGSETHPMHPHGHHVLVVSRDGVPVTGSPIWLDSFDVQPGEVWEVLLRADNPGIWMAHCHNLDHANRGMVVHLAYEGVSTPFRLGGPADNRPE